jgi:hypothetical protein
VRRDWVEALLAEGNLEEARRLQAETAHAWEEAGAMSGSARLHVQLSYFDWELGRYEQAEQLARSALPQFEKERAHCAARGRRPRRAPSWPRRSSWRKAPRA